MKKRIITATLAAFMAAATLATTASASTTVAVTTAAASDVEGQAATEVKIESAIAAPAIKVAAPTGTINYALNPYKLSVQLGSGTATSAQIISQVMAFENKSDTPVDVYVSAAATVAGKAKLASADPNAKAPDTGNQVFLYVVATDPAAAAVTAVPDAEYDKASTKQLVIAAKAAEKKLATLALPGTGATKYVGMNIQGAMSKAPKIPWDATADKVDVTFTYRFEAVTNTDA